MHKYRNRDENHINVVGYGVVKPGEEFETDLDIVSESIVRVDQSGDENPTVPQQPAPAPAESTDTDEVDNG